MNRSGFLLFEALLGIALLTVFIGATTMVLLRGQESTVKSGDYNRAVALTEQVLAAVRAMRDEDFCAIDPGTHGLRIGSDGRWEFDGIETVSMDGFTTNVFIVSVDSETISATATTVWQDPATGREKSVSLTEELSDWRRSLAIADWSDFYLESWYVDDSAQHSGGSSSSSAGTGGGDYPLFNDIAIRGNTLFAVRSGGKGMYLFDITDTDNFVRIANNFTLNGHGHEAARRGLRLYVVREHKDEEVAAYDITDPATWDQTTNPVAIYDLPKNSRARSLAIVSDTLIVGATQDDSETELYAFNISNPDAITFWSSVHSDGDLLDIDMNSHSILPGDYAYIASTGDVSELRVADVTVGSDIRMPAGSGYNLVGNSDGYAIEAFGTSALLGRASGAATEELVLFDVSQRPQPYSPPSPLFHEVGDNVNDLAVSPGGKYAFLATDKNEKEFVIIDIDRFRRGQNPEVGSFDLTNIDDPDELEDVFLGDGRTVHYDIVRDRVFLGTDTAFLIFAPTNEAPRGCP